MLVGHQKQWDFLKRRFEQNQLSHAYLFTGSNQIGKRTFAKEFAKMISCKSTEEEPCQKCVNCQMIERGSYPDLFLVNPEEGGEISISKAREAQNFLSYKSYYGSFKFVIVDQAEKMNAEAQSCFLKTLEEPKGQTLLILVTSKPEMLLPTIYSRCQNVKFFTVSTKNIENHLVKLGADKKKVEMFSAISEGKPGRACEAFLNPEKIDEENELLGDILKVLNSDFSEKFKYVKSLDFENNKLSKILLVLEKYFRYLLFLKTGVGEIKEQKYFPKHEAMQNFTVTKIKTIVKLIEDINFQTLFTNASPKLALEILLMEI